MDSNDNPINLDNALFRLECGDDITANIEFSIKKVLNVSTVVSVGEELIDLINSPGNSNVTYPFEDSGELEVTGPNSLNWKGDGNDSPSAFGRYSNLLQNIGFYDGDNLLITLTITNYQNSLVTSDRVGFAATTGMSGMQADENTELSKIFIKDSSISDNSYIFLNLEKNATNADMEISVKKITGTIIPESGTTDITEVTLSGGTPGNVPKGFQINDISIIYRTKNVR